MGWLILAGIGALIVAAAKAFKSGTKWVRGYVKGESTLILVSSIGPDVGHNEDVLLRDDAATAFQLMRAHAAAQGLELHVTEGFRTMERQEYFWRKHLAGTGAKAARPGYSNHQGGIAVDIQVGGTTSSPVFQWLAANAADFGWSNSEGARVGEPWHWTFTGTGKGIA